MSSNRDEFQLIDALARVPGARARGVVTGIGDDAAVLRPPRDRDVVASNDVQVAGVHFEWAWLTPRQVGRRAAHTAVSDLAAMGATPWTALVSLAIPDEQPDEDVIAVQRGIAAGLGEVDAAVVGGNITRAGDQAPFAVHLTVLGTVPRNRAILRGRSKPGDRIWVSGLPGRAALGRHGIAAGVEAPADARAFRRPQARVALGRGLAPLATAMIDVSDGLSQDLHHLLGERGATVDWPSLEPGRGFRARAARLGLDTRSLVLSGGEDYELLFTAPERVSRRIESLGARVRVRVRPIGRVVETADRVLVDRDGSRSPLPAQGFRHRGPG